MKTVKNKSREPLRVPLPRGKVLFLGPLRTGKISHNDLDHEPLKKLVEAGKLEIQEDGRPGFRPHGDTGGPHEETHGHHPESGPQIKGDR